MDDYIIHEKPLQATKFRANIVFDFKDYTNSWDFIVWIYI